MCPRPWELTTCGRRPTSSTESRRVDFQTRCHLTLRTAEPGSVQGTHTALPIGSWRSAKQTPCPFPTWVTEARKHSVTCPKAHKGGRWQNHLVSAPRTIFCAHEPRRYGPTFRLNGPTTVIKFRLLYFDSRSKGSLETRIAWAQTPLLGVQGRVRTLREGLAGPLPKEQASPSSRRGRSGPAGRPSKAGLVRPLQGCSQIQPKLWLCSTPLRRSVHGS